MNHRKMEELIKKIDTPPPACFDVSVINSNQIWKTGNVMKTGIPPIAATIVMVVFFSHLLFFIYKPLHQPRIISHITAGFLIQNLGSFFPSSFKYLFPVSNMINIEVLSNIGVIYYAFLSGLEMNLNTILHVKKKSATIAIFGIIFPMVMGPALYLLHRNFYGKGDGSELEENTTNACVIWTLVLTVTGFPVIAHTLSELKLLYTGLGKVALTTAMISDTYAWILFILFVPFSVNGTSAIYPVLSTVIFVFICIFVVHPIIAKVINRKTERDEWDGNQLVFVVMGLFVFSYITDILGTHDVVGAFVYGLILPHGKFADMVTSMTNDFGGGFLAPIYFIGSGLKLMFVPVFYQPSWPFTLIIILLMCVLKILSTLFSTFLFGMRTRDGFALGLLLNTKGVVALIMLNISWDRMIITPPTYVVLTSAVILMTIVVAPIINVIYKPKKRYEQNKLKTIQKLRLDAELRILACVHNTRQAVGVISLIESFNATRLSPMHIFALYLVELVGRDGAVVASHMEKPSGQSRTQNLTRSQIELESIDNKFEALREAYDAIRVETLNVVSEYATIQEDIYNLVNEKHTSLILLPFHKQLSPEGAFETTDVAFKDINLNVMQSAPCSVGLFVDRNLGSLPKMNFRICMIFVGGPDDREALAVAWRMTGHLGTQLLVVRMLLFGKAAIVDTTSHDKARGILSMVMDSEKQKELDDEYVNGFRLTTMNSNDSISYSEVDVHSAEDIPTSLNEIEKIGCDLYVVGQGNRRNTRVFLNLLEWCDCPELGVLGDILASNNFGSGSSVLVVQQYGYGGMVLGKQPNQVTDNNDAFEVL